MFEKHDECVKAHSSTQGVITPFQTHFCSNASFHSVFFIVDIATSAMLHTRLVENDASPAMKCTPEMWEVNALPMRHVHLAWCFEIHDTKPSVWKSQISHAEFSETPPSADQKTESGSRFNLKTHDWDPFISSALRDIMKRYDSSHNMRNPPTSSTAAAVSILDSHITQLI